MSKIALIGDTHFGVRGGDPNFLSFQKAWFDEIFFPYLKKNGIKEVIQSGDFFDTRQHIKLNVMHEIRTWFVEKSEELDLTWNVIVGNHDIFYRDNNKINSIKWVNDIYPNFDVYEDNVGVKFFGTAKFAFMPWINKNNKEKLLEQLSLIEDVDVVVGHFELSGFPMYSGFLNEHGMETDFLKDYPLVISGHYHTVSNHKNIQYLGTPYHLTWSDFPDGINRGFWVLDTDTMELELIKNPEWCTMFSVIEYDPEEDYKLEDFDIYEGNISKIIISEVREERHKKKFVELLSKAKFLDYKIIDTTNIKIDKVEISTEAIEAKDLVKVMEEYVDKQEIDINKNNLKSLAKRIYQEALNVV